MSNSPDLHVFISYSHDSPAHSERVLALSDRLLADGVDCTIDQYVESPPTGWARWTRGQVKQADFVLIVCTKTYHERYIGNVEEKGLGVNWEGVVITQLLYNTAARNTRFIPVQFSDGDPRDIPTELGGATRYVVDTPDGYEALYRRLTGQPAAVKPPRGQRRVLPPKGPGVSLFSAGGATDPAGTANGPSAVVAPRQLMPPTDPNLFVGRGHEIELLDRCWNHGDGQIVQLVADGGAGKSTVAWHWLTRQQQAGYPGASQILDWSFYNQGAHTQATDSHGFLESAVRHFAELGFRPDDETRSHPDLLGRFVGDAFVRVGGLMILDGTEALQSPPDVDDGRVLDVGLDALIRVVRAAPTPTADGPRRLLLVTTRWAIPEVVGPGTVTHPVSPLSEVEGAELLRTFRLPGEPTRGLFVAQGVGANSASAVEHEFRSTSSEYGGHPLSLVLLASYLLRRYGGDLAMRRQVPVVPELYRDHPHRHARRIMAAYEGLFAEDSTDPIARACRAVLSLVSLFDGPTDARLIRVVRQGEPIPSLTDGLTDELFEVAVAELKRLQFVSGAGTTGDASDGALSTHPLIRHHFREALQRRAPDAWRAANARLFEHALRESSKAPMTLDDMQPHLTAIAYGCRAGRHQEALDLIYFGRLQRSSMYAGETLGAYGPLLAALAHFFEPGTRRRPLGSGTETEPTLTPDAQRAVLNQAAVCLQALDRHVEAEAVFNEVIARTTAAGDWQASIINADNLNELYVALGRLGAAERTAVEIGKLHASATSSVRYSLETLATLRVTVQTSQALVWHAQGKLYEASALLGRADSSNWAPSWSGFFTPFGSAFGRQRFGARDPRQVPHVLMSGLHGYHLADVLIDLGRDSDAAERCLYMQQLAQDHDALSTALAALLLGRIETDRTRSVVGLMPRPEAAPLYVESAVTQAITTLSDAVSRIRDVGMRSILPLALLARAEARWQRRLITVPSGVEPGSPDSLDAPLPDLDEAREVADRGSYLGARCDIALFDITRRVVQSVVGLDAGQAGMDAGIAQAEDQREVAARIVEGRHPRQDGPQDGYRRRESDLILADAAIEWAKERRALASGNQSAADQHSNRCVDRIKAARSLAQERRYWILLPRLTALEQARA